MLGNQTLHFSGFTITCDGRAGRKHNIPGTSLVFLRQPYLHRCRAADLVLAAGDGCLVYTTQVFPGGSISSLPVGFLFLCGKTFVNPSLTAYLYHVDIWHTFKFGLGGEPTIVRILLWSVLGISTKMHLCL